MDKSDSERGSRAQARLEEEGVMGWVKQLSTKSKMDAEAKSYSDGITW